MAAGKGTRMQSSKPKVLHRLGGRALAQHVLDTTARMSVRSVVVITGHGADQVEAGLVVPGHAVDLRFVRQEPQLGTGHAVQQAEPVLADDGVTLILNGDVPLIQADTLQRLLQMCEGKHLTLLSVDTGADAAGYGRVLREGPGASVSGIVEHKDASEQQRRITEWYSGVMAVPTLLLKRLLAQLTNHNTQREYYLTDVVRYAVEAGCEVRALVTRDEIQVAGVNSPLQLAALERAHQRRVAEGLMEQGVRLADPARLDVRGELVCGADVDIDVNCVFSGQVSLGQGVRIGANCVIANARIHDGAVIHPFTHIDGEKLGVEVGAGSLIGPFARLRKGAHLCNHVHMGNFGEVKDSTLGPGVKTPAPRRGLQSAGSANRRHSRITPEKSPPPSLRANRVCSRSSLRAKNPCSDQRASP